LLGTSGLRPAPAEEVKPLAVVSLSAYDELAADVQFLGKIAGKPELGKQIQAMLNLVTQGKGLAGLDKTRPSGAVIFIDGGRPSGYGFLPVTDVNQLHEVFKPLISEVTEVDGGIHKVQGKAGGKPAYVKEKEGWLFFSDKPEPLAKVPADPCQLLAALSQQYDLGVRFYVQHVPAEFRQKLIEKLKSHAEKDLQQKPGETDEEHALRKLFGEHLLRTILCAGEQLEQITFGYALDHDAEKVIVELGATAIEGTEAAQALAHLDQTKTNFGGFRIPGAAVTWSCAGRCYHGDTAKLGEAFDAIRTLVIKKIDAAGRSEEEAQVAKDLAAGLLDVTEETLASGRLDAGMSIRLRPNAATLVVGRYVADGPKLEKVLGQLVDAARRKHPDFVNKVLKANADQYQGVRFHVVSIPIAPETKHRDKVVQLIGETLEIVVGIGDQSYYLSAGRDALKTLKQAIERSQTRSFQTIPPAELSIDLGRVAKFMAAVGEEKHQAKAREAAALLQKAAGEDRVHFIALPIERGVKYRLELEAGVLSLIGAMHKK